MKLCLTQTLDKMLCILNICISALADMDASDTAIVTIKQGSGAAQTDINTASAFSGFLAC